MPTIDVVANGSVASFNGADLKVVTINPAYKAALIDGTQLGSTTHENGVGLNDPEVRMTVLGWNTSFTVGTAGALSVTPVNGTPDDFGGGDFAVQHIAYEGVTVDGAMVTTITLIPAQITQA